MFDLYAPNGEKIVGTSERLPCRADVFGFTRDTRGRVQPEFTGRTEVFWDAQEFTQDADGQIVCLDARGDSWPLSACTPGKDDGQPSPNGLEP